MKQRFCTGLLTAALMTAACDDSAGSDSDASVEADDMSGETCEATFTEDYQFTNVSGSPGLAVKKGERLLVSSLGAFRTTLLAEGPDGAVDWSLDPDEVDPLPFTTNCTESNSAQFLVVFKDVSVYKDALFAEEACKLMKGQSASTNGFSFSLIPDTGGGYEVSGNGLKTLCGVSNAFMKAERTMKGTVGATSLYSVRIVLKTK